MTTARRWADHPAAAWVVAAAALAAAWGQARPASSGWNDRSRLAAVESLVARGTLAIDDSPYAADTADKAFVGGHYYSHHPPLVAVLLAAAYDPLVRLGVPPPADRPDVFCRAMALLTGGLGFAAAAGCLWALGRRVGLPPLWRALWLAAFALSTVALTYTMYVNAHAPQLGAVAGVCVLLARTADLARDGRTAWGSLVGIGTLAGVGVSLDFGGGPLLVGAVLVAVGWRFRRVGPVLAVGLAAAPWVAAAVGLNYAVGGGWKPLGMYPEYFTWPGSPFTPDNLTGFARRPAAEIGGYAGRMLVGEQGFLPFNLPLLAALAGAWGAFRRPSAGRAELGCLLAWCGATWLLYAVLSNNMSGRCCSVRWFVPFLAPGFWLLAIVLRDQPARRPGFLVAAWWGHVLAAATLPFGPWNFTPAWVVWHVARRAWRTWAAVEVVVLAWRLVAGRPTTAGRPAPAAVEREIERRAA